ncbi:UNVERIFIED_CONTAM: hypothetical protein FKN15_027862 [Acipenser sinensis]
MARDRACVILVWALVLPHCHNYFTEHLGLPVWGSYAIFALATLFSGLVLGLILVFVADCVFPFRRFTPQNYYQSKSPFLFCNWIYSCACIPVVCCGPGLSAVCAVPAQYTVQYICMELICVCVVRCLLSALTLLVSSACSREAGSGPGSDHEEAGGGAGGGRGG